MLEDAFEREILAENVFEIPTKRAQAGTDYWFIMQVPEYFNSFRMITLISWRYFDVAVGYYLKGTGLLKASKTNSHSFWMKREMYREKRLLLLL